VLVFLWIMLLRQSAVRRKLDKLSVSSDQQMALLKHLNQHITGSDEVKVEETESIEQNLDSQPELALLSETKIYIGNVDYDTTEDELEDHFDRFGEIESVNIPVNRYNGKARGFGFIAFASENAAASAVQLDGTEFRGRQIQVKFAKERAEA
jgi:cold-inducible RNA-binding protein